MIEFYFKQAIIFRSDLKIGKGKIVVSRRRVCWGICLQGIERLAQAVSREGFDVCGVILSALAILFFCAPPDE